MNGDEKQVGKESETNRSLYCFLVDDWLKTLLEKPIKEEVTKLTMEDPNEKKGENLEDNEGN